MYSKSTLAAGILSLCIFAEATAQTAAKPAAPASPSDTTVKVVTGYALRKPIKVNTNALHSINVAPKVVTGYAKGMGNEVFVVGEPATFNEADTNLNKKEISQEVTVSKGADIFIENSNRAVEIKIWDQPKVKVVTTVYYEGEGGKISDEEWLDKLNIAIKSTANTVRVKSGPVSGGGSYTINSGSNNFSTYSWSSGGSVAIFNGKGQNIGNRTGKRILTIYVPKENKLDVESKYADVSVTGSVGKVNIDITNGNLEIGDTKSLVLRSKYGNVNAGNIGSAEVEFMNGRFSAKDIDDLDIDTKYSTVEAGLVKKANIRSVNDEYEIEEAGVLQGRKNYGNLRITKLTGSIELDGTNADVRLRKIEPSVSLIKFNNKYADLRIPFTSIKNFNLTFNGSYSSIYGNFDKKPITKEKEDAKKEKDEVGETVRKALKSVGYGDDNLDTHFTATGGDGKGTKVDIKCQNCTVDFK